MYKISFCFDEVTKSVSNLKVDGYVPKIKNINTTTESYDLIVEENKLVLSKDAINKIGARPDDRISVEYWSEGIGKSIPIIGKSQVFTDRLNGNRLTQKGTVAFRGEKRATLIQFGTIFNLEEFKDGIWKLVPVTVEQDALSEEIDDVKALDDSAIDAEIDKLISNDDDLPF